MTRHARGSRSIDDPWQRFSATLAGRCPAGQARHRSNGNGMTKARFACGSWERIAQ